MRCRNCGSKPNDAARKRRRLTQLHFLCHGMFIGSCLSLHQWGLAMIGVGALCLTWSAQEGA